MRHLFYVETLALAGILALAASLNGLKYVGRHVNGYRFRRVSNGEWFVLYPNDTMSLGTDQCRLLGVL